MHGEDKNVGFLYSTVSDILNYNNHQQSILLISLSCTMEYIIESVDSISRDEQDAPLAQYITNAGITRARYTSTHYKHHHRVLWPISNRTNV